MYMFALMEYVFLYKPILNSVCVLLVNILYVNLFFKPSQIKGLISAAVYTALLNLSEWIIMLFLTFLFGKEISQVISTLPMYILGIAMSKTLLLLLSILVAKLAFSRGTSSTTERTPAFLFIFPLSVLIIDFSFWEIAAQAEPSAATKTLIITGSTVMLVSVLLTYVFYGNAMRRNREFFQLQNAYEKVRVDQEYYKILDRQNEDLRTFKHDEKNHLNAIKAMASDSDRVCNYIDRILGEPQFVSPIGNTKNKMLDLLLGKYTYLCKMKEIRFSYSAITSNLSFLEDTDLVALLSNILDNAVEASETAEDKWIELSFESRVAGMTILTCTNSSGNAPVSQKGKLVTSKDNPRQHGIGVKSIMRIAKKYDDTFEWSWDDASHTFTAQIVFER